MTIIGLAWFSKGQWEHLQRITADEVEETWEEWATNAERMVAQLKKKGVHVETVAIDVSELELYCRAKGKPCDSAARAELATLKLKAK